MLIPTYVHLMRSPLNNLVFQWKRDTVTNTYVEMLAFTAFAKEKLGGMHFLIIRKRFFFFLLKCSEACDPVCFSSPSVPIKAVFLQQILS